MANYTLTHKGHTVEVETVDGVGRQPYALLSAIEKWDGVKGCWFTTGYKVHDVGTHSQMTKALKSWAHTSPELLLEIAKARN